MEIMAAAERKKAEEAIRRQEHEVNLQRAVNSVNNASIELPLFVDVGGWPMEYKQRFAELVLSAGYKLYQLRLFTPYSTDPTSPLYKSEEDLREPYEPTESVAKDATAFRVAYE